MAVRDLSPESIRRTAFFTGHRIIGKAEIPMLKEKIFRAVSDAYDSGYRRFYCGCATGFDTLAAFQALRLREIHPAVRLLLAVPFPGQADRWAEEDRVNRQKLIGLADEITVVSPVYYSGVMLARNRFMADRSSLCICWLRNMRGGTAYTVRYALRQDRIRIINLAVREADFPERLKEESWNCMFISRSAGRNAVTVPLRLFRRRKLIMKGIRNSF